MTLLIIVAVFWMFVLCVDLIVMSLMAPLGWLTLIYLPSSVLLTAMTGGLLVTMVRDA